MNQVVRALGFEDEFVISDSVGKIPSYDEVRDLFEGLVSLGFEKKADFYFVRDKVIITQDSGYALLEIIFPPIFAQSGEFDLSVRAAITYEVAKYFQDRGYLLLAGSSPKPINSKSYYDYTSRKPRAKAFIHLHPETQHYHYFGSATHFNMSFEHERDLVRVFNVLNKLSAIFLLLTARQKLWLGEVTNVQTMSKYSWHLSAEEINDPERFGMFPFEIKSIQDYMNYVRSKPILFLEDDVGPIIPASSFSFSDTMVHNYFEQDVLSGDNFFLPSSSY